MSPPGEMRPMGFDGMDSNPENLKHGSGAPAVEPGAREWPGVSRESAPAKVQFPGEDGGKSLAKMAERDLDAALQLLAERAQYITGATGAAIALRDGDEMVCRASAGGSAPEIGARLQMDSGLSGESIRTRRMLRCDDALTDERVNRESCEALGIASVVVMPMLDGGEVIGVFELFSDRARAFEERDITALERMGGMVRTALEQVEGARDEGRGEEKTVEHPEVDDPEVENPGAALQSAATQIVKAAEAAPQKEMIPGQVAETRPSEQGLFRTAPEGEARGSEVQAFEPEVGEIARDAAARTAAWKASLFQEEAPATKTSEPASERIAFHMRMPKKSGLTPATAEVRAPAAVPVSASQREEEHETPRVEDSDEVDAKSVPAAAREAAGSAPGIAAVTGSGGAAAAPARSQEVATTKTVAGAKIQEKTAEAPPARVGAAGLSTDPTPPIAVTPIKQAAAKPTTKESGVGKDPTAAATAELQKGKGEVARPASAEGRSRIAVSQVRKCESCGFPVSEGRKYCLDCEKKNAQAGSTTNGKQEAAGRRASVITEPAIPEPAITSPTVTGNERQVAEQPAGVGGAVPNLASAELKSATEAKATGPESGREKIVENNKPEAIPAEDVHAAEPPFPQFMVSSPDHYESWIVSHMYTAVAIAVIVLGVVVYLLSR